MTTITMQFTPQELELLTGLASDQLFRREFIDHRLPGCKTDSGELARAKELVGRLRSQLNPHTPKRVPTAIAAR